MSTTCPRLAMPGFCAVVLAGCAAPANYGEFLSSWNSKDEEDLVRQWGRPTQDLRSRWLKVPHLFFQSADSRARQSSRHMKRQLWAELRPLRRSAAYPPAPL